MKKRVKLFESFLNENLFEERVCETYFYLRISGVPEEEVTDFVLKEFTMDADELGSLLLRWLDDHNFKGSPDKFVKAEPRWFNDGQFNSTRYPEIKKFWDNKEAAKKK